MSAWLLVAVWSSHLSSSVVSAKTKSIMSFTNVCVMSRVFLCNLQQCHSHETQGINNDGDAEKFFSPQRGEKQPFTATLIHYHSSVSQTHTFVVKTNTTWWVMCAAMPITCKKICAADWRFMLTCKNKEVERGSGLAVCGPKKRFDLSVVHLLHSLLADWVCL